MAVLQVRNLTKHFGGLAAVSGLDFDVEEREILGLIGPNGAGKSTVLNLIGGTLTPSGGKIVFRGEDITNCAPWERARRGIARVFQRNTLFRSMTALENVVAGSYLLFDGSLTDIVFRTNTAIKRENALRERAMDILRFVGLEKHADGIAVNLPHGNQRALCIAVALAVEPKLLLLDEPLTGMNPQEALAMTNLVKTLRDTKGITTIVVEHNMKAVLGLCDRLVVLNFGKKIAEGAPRVCVDDPAVVEAYLGAGEDVA